MKNMNKYKIDAGFLTTLENIHFCSKIVKGKIGDGPLSRNLNSLNVIDKTSDYKIIRHSEGVCIESDDTSIILWTHSNGDPVGLDKWRYIAGRILEESLGDKDEHFNLEDKQAKRFADKISELYIKHLSKCETAGSFYSY